MLEKLKKFRESKMLPHYIGTALGVVAALIIGGMVSAEADDIQLVIEQIEEAHDDGTDSELSE